ncbi:MAG: tetratricopeptide repeat protein [bacterium]
MSALSELLEEINKKINPEALLRKINYYPDEVQRIGDRMKAFCPLHEEKAFRSLIIDVKQNTFRCTMTRCVGFKGGSLVDLYGRCKQLEPLAATMELIRILTMDVDVGMFHRLAQSLLDSAIDLKTSGDFQGALQQVEESLSVEPSFRAARRFLVELHVQQDRIKEAVAQLLFIAESDIKDDQLGRALEALNQVVKLDPTNGQALLKVAEIQEKKEDFKAAAQIYQQACDLFEKSGRSEEATPLYHRILTFDSTNTAVREALAKNLETRGEKDEARSHYFELARAHEEKGDKASAISTYDHINEMDGFNFDAKEKKAGLLLELGQGEEGQRELLDLARKALEHGELDPAEKVLKTILKSQPKHTQAVEELAKVFEAKGSISQAAEMYARLSQIAIESDDLNTAAAWLEKAREKDPNQVAVREQLAELYLRNNERDKAVDEISNLAFFQLEKANVSEGRRLLNRFRELAPTDVPRRVDAARKLEALGLAEDAVEDLSDLAGTLMKANKPAEAVEVCGEGLRTAADDVGLLECRVNAHKALGLNRQAIEDDMLLASVLTRKGHKDAAERALRGALELDEHEPEVLGTLGNLLVGVGRGDEATEIFKHLCARHEETGKDDLAIQVCQRVLEFACDDLWAREKLASLLARREETAAAFKEYLSLANLHEGRGEYEATRGALQKCLKLEPHSLEILNRLSGLVLEKEGGVAAFPFLVQRLEALKTSGKDKEIEKAFRQLLDLDKSNEDVRRQHIDFLRERGKRDEATAEMRTLASQLIEAGKAEPAADLLLEGLKFAPEDAEIRRELAKAYEMEERNDDAAEQYLRLAEGCRSRGEKDKAVEDYEKVFTLAPTLRKEREEFAKYLEELGRRNEAISHYRWLAGKSEQEGDLTGAVLFLWEALRLDEKSVEAHLQLAKALEGVEKKEEAAGQYLWLARTQQKKKSSRDALSYAEKAKGLSPDQREVRELLVGLYSEAKQKDKAKREAKELADLYFAEESLKQAEDWYAKALEYDANDLEIAERLGDLREKRGDAQGAVDAYLRIADHREKEGALNEATRLLRRLKSLAPERFDLRERLAGVSVKAGKGPEARKEYLALANDAFGQGATKEGIAYCEKSLEAAGENVSAYIEAAVLLGGFGEVASAVETYRAGAELGLRLQQAAGALETLNEGLKLDHYAFALRELKLKALAAMGQKTELGREQLLLARDYFEREKSEEAIGYLGLVLDGDPKNFEARNLRVECYLQHKNKWEAIEDLLEMSKLHEEDDALDLAVVACERILREEDRPETRRRLGYLHLKAGNPNLAVSQFDHLAEHYLEAGDFEKAGGYLSQLLELAPESMEALRRKGRLTLKMEGPEAARPWFARLLEQLKKRGSPKDLIAEYEEVLKGDLENLDLRTEFANCLKEQGDKTKAKDQWLKILRLTRDAENFERALQAAQEASDLDPDDLMLVAEMGTLHHKLGNEVEALRCRVSAAEGYVGKREPKKAIEQYQLCLEIFPDDVKLLSQSAALYEKIEEPEKAAGLLQKVLALQESGERVDEQMATLTRILELMPLRVDLREKLAAKLEGEKRLDEAAEQYEQVADLHEKNKNPKLAQGVLEHLKGLRPREGKYRRQLGEIYLKLGDKPGALEEWKEAAALSREGRDLETAEKLLRMVLEHQAEDLSAGESLAEVLLAKGDEKGSVEEFSRVAGLCESQKEFDKGADHCKRALDIDPGRVELREKFVELLRKVDHEEEAARQVIEVARSYFDQKKEKKAFQACRRVADIVPLSLELRLQAGSLLEERGYPDRAYEEYRLLASHLVDSSKFQEAIRACEAGLNLKGEETVFRELRIRAFAGLGEKEEALKDYEALAEACKGSKNRGRLEKIYRAALEIAPGSAKFREALIGFYIEGKQTKRAAEELALLGGLHREEGRLDDSLTAYQRWLELDKNALDCREKIVEILVGLGRTKDAVVEGLDLAGRYEKVNRDAARAHYEKVLQLEARNLKALRGLAGLAKQGGDREGYIELSFRLGDELEKIGAHHDAQRVYETLLESEKNYLPALEKLAACFRLQGDRNKFLEYSEKLRDKYDSQGDVERALECSGRLLEEEKERAAYLDRQGILLLKAGREEEALETWRHAIAMLHKKEEFAEASEMEEKYLDRRPEAVEIRESYATSLEKLGKTSDAVKQMLQLCDMHEGSDPDKAIEMLARVLKLEPRRIDERHKYAALLAKNQREKECAQQYLILAGDWVRKGRLETAIEECRRGLETDLGNFGAHQLLATVLCRRGDTEAAIAQLIWLAQNHQDEARPSKAEACYTMAIALDENAMEPKRNYADFLFGEGRTEEASEQLLALASVELIQGFVDRAIVSLERVRNVGPENLSLRKRLVELYESSGHFENAEAELFTTADLYMKGGFIEEANELFRSLLERRPEAWPLLERVGEFFERQGIPELAVESYVELGQRHLSAGRTKEALEWAERAVEKRPRSRGGWELKFAAQKALGHDAELYDTCLTLYELRLDAEAPDECVEALREMIRMRPDEPDPRRKIIPLLVKLGRQEESEDEIHHLAKLYVTRGELDEALNFSKRLVTLRPDDTAIRLEYLDLLGSGGGRVDELKDHLAVVGSLIKSGATVEARKLFEKLLELQPNSAELHERYSKFLLDQGEKERAKEIALRLADIYRADHHLPKSAQALREALKIAPENTELQMKLCDTYEAMNARGNALEILGQFVGKYKSRGAKSELREAYERYLRLDPQNLQIRSEMVELLFDMGDHEAAVKQGLELADNYVKRGLLDLAEREYRRILEVEPLNIKVWNYLVDTHLQIGLEEDLIPDYIILAELYLKNEQLRDACRTFQKVFQLDPENLEIRQRYIDTYLQVGLEVDLVGDYIALAEGHVKREEYAEALTQYKRVMSLDANCGLKEKVAEVEWLKEQKDSGLEAGKEGAGAAVRAARQAEQRLSEQDKIKDIQKNYLSVLKINPQNTMVRSKLAELLEQQGQEDEAYQEWDKVSEAFVAKGELSKAIDLCERLLKKRPTDAKIRDRLSRAIFKRDSFKVLDSAIQLRVDSTRDRIPRLEDPANKPTDD